MSYYTHFLFMKTIIFCIHKLYCDTTKFQIFNLNFFCNGLFDKDNIFFDLKKYYHNWKINVIL